jgi:thioesterase domain-containing protein
MKNIQERIHSEIPISKAMAFEILGIEPQATRTRMKLEPNTNHLGTLFGGSLYALGALSCYSALLGLLEQRQVTTKNIVITHGDIDYLSPGTGDCEAIVKTDADDIEGLLKSLKVKKRGRITFTAEISQEGRGVALVNGTYLVRI